MRRVAPRAVSAAGRPALRSAPLTSAPTTAAWLRAALVPVALLAAVWALYGDALGYAFMYDDGIDLARGEQRSVLSLLTSGEGAFYYRPLPFIIWKAMHAALGRYDPFWFHLLPLLLHALNAWLLYRMARTLGLGAVAALVAAGLFVTFPFHYQVVPWAGALFHPLVTALMLGALLTYREARCRRSVGWLGVSLACGLLALFTQEYAVTLGVLVAGLELWLWRQRAVAHPRPYALLYLGLAGAFALWWVAVPKWPRAFAVDGVSLVRNGLMFLQALLWPLAIAWRWAPPALLVRPEAAVAGAAALALPGAVALYARRRALGWLALALGWVAVTALPVWATLPWQYVEDGARLYYLPSVGIALAWGGLAALVPRHGHARLLGRALVVALCLWAVAQSVAFLAPRRAMYAEGTALLRAAVARASAAPVGGTVLFVNLPAWEAPDWPAFPLGNTGVTFVPEYVLLGQALHVNGAGPAPVASLATTDLPGGWPAHYGPHGAWASLDEIEAAARGATAAYVTRFGPDRLALEPLALAPLLGAEPRAGPAVTLP
ncbi:MAG TPA: hypothetical protein VK066_08885 [Chloroflexota bacterium]|nr:hypothetical protein [Chloroflexota bacterium]